MWKLEPSPRHESLGCLFALLGMVLGAVLGGRHVRHKAAAILANDPDHVISGNAFLGAVMAAAFLGATVSAILGIAIGRIFPGKPSPALDSTQDSYGEAGKA